MSYFGSVVLLDEAAGPALRVRLRETDSTEVSVSLTLAESSVATPGPCEG